MENKRTLLMCMVFLFMISLQPITAQIDKISIAPENANFEIINPDAYFIEIAGPNGYYFKNEVEQTSSISISNVKKDGTKFSDGLYQFKVTPILKLTDSQRTDLTKLRQEGNAEKLAAYRLANNLPENVETHLVHFSIRNGEFVSPDQKETKGLSMPKMSGLWQQDHPILYASINPVSVDYGTKAAIGVLPAMDNTAEDDQVFVDDVIIDGSLCVGMDCVNGENFGFDTQRIKENNVRLHFDDTSSSASFPSQDWRITINDSSNGGANYFAIEDATAGRIPFRIIGNAPANSLYIDAQGDVGIGTANPILELHIADGDTPTARLEQDGSSGFGSQTWDIAGNETNFFVRDVTNGSQLPFKIFPGADHNSLVIDKENEIGIGVQNPSYKLQVESGDVYVKSGKIGVNTEPTTFDFEVLGSAQFDGNVIFKGGDPSFFLSNGSSWLTPTFNTILRLDAANNKVGIGTISPATELEVCGTISATNTTVSMSTTCSSDIRFKENVSTLESSLDKLLQLRGVNYYWKAEEFPQKGFNNKNQIGFIAQEMENLFPELVTTDANGYKAVDYAKLSPVVVEAIKEQQQLIDSQKAEIVALQQQVDELQGLRAQVEALTGMVTNLNSSDQQEEEQTGEKE